MDDLARRLRPRRYASKTFKREFAVLAGFDPSASVMTEDGEVPLEWLGEGDRLLTQDGQFQKVLWIERSKLRVEQMRAFPEIAPVRLERGVLDGDLPKKHIWVSPSQLVFVARDASDASAGGVFVPASVIGQQVSLDERPADEQMTYVSILLPAHHPIQIDGAWMGSLFVADLATEIVPSDPLRAQLDAEIMEPAAPILGHKEAAQFLASRHITRAEKSA